MTKTKLTTAGRLQPARLALGLSGALSHPGVPSSSASSAASAGSALEPEMMLSPEPPSPSRFINPFAEHARGGRLPFITQDRIGREVKMAREEFNERAMHKLKAWNEKVGRRMDPGLYPSFMRSGKKFSILIDGYRVHMTDILGHGAYGFVFKAEIETTSGSRSSGCAGSKESSSNSDYGSYTTNSSSGVGTMGGGGGLEVAVKFLFRTRRSSPPSSVEFKKARRLPQSLFSSGRIVEYLALCECARYAHSEAELVVMELAEMGDLYDSLIQDGAPRLYSANHARRLIVMATEAMAELRQAGFLHRDLKAENLLFNHFGQMLLGDIGNVKDLEGKKPEQVQTVLGTFATMAPEVSLSLSSGKRQALYDCEKSDVWSLGCIYFQLRTCLSVLNDKLLKTSLRDLSEATSTPTCSGDASTGLSSASLAHNGGEGRAMPPPATVDRRANHKFWHKFECWQRNIHGPDGVYFVREDLKWTRDYRAEPFSKGERDFLDCLLCADHHKRPTFEELMRAVNGQLGARDALRWLGEGGNAAGRDTTKAFDEVMQKRISGFGQRKNTYSWVVDGRTSAIAVASPSGTGDDSSAAGAAKTGMLHVGNEVDRDSRDGGDVEGGVEAVSPDEYMEALAEQLRDTISKVVSKMKYRCDVDDPKKLTRTANCIHLRCTIRGPTPLRSRLLRLEAEIAKPTPELTGVITFVRQRGDPALYLQLIKRFERHCLTTMAATTVADVSGASQSTGAAISVAASGGGSAVAVDDAAPSSATLAPLANIRKK